MHEAHSGKLDPEFKKLITLMLQYHAFNRPTIMDVIGHPWMARGACATLEQVQEEFRQRHEINRRIALADQEEKQARRTQVSSNAYRALRSNILIYRDRDLEANNPLEFVKTDSV